MQLIASERICERLGQSPSSKTPINLTNVDLIGNGSNVYFKIIDIPHTYDIISNIHLIDTFDGLMSIELCHSGTRVLQLQRNLFHSGKIFPDLYIHGAVYTPFSIRVKYTGTGRIGIYGVGEFHTNDVRKDIMRTPQLVQYVERVERIKKFTAVVSLVFDVVGQFYIDGMEEKTCFDGWESVPQSIISAYDSVDIIPKTSVCYMTKNTLIVAGGMTSTKHEPQK